MLTSSEEADEETVRRVAGERLDAHDEQLGKCGERLDGIDATLVTHGERLDKLEETVKEKAAAWRRV